jgi:hypothetical protein
MDINITDDNVDAEPRRKMIREAMDDGAVGERLRLCEDALKPTLQLFTKLSNEPCDAEGNAEVLAQLAELLARKYQDIAELSRQIS